MALFDAKVVLRRRASRKRMQPRYGETEAMQVSPGIFSHSVL